MARPVHLAVLEVKRFLADRGDLAFSIALPIALFALMLGVFGGETSFNGTAHIVDLDGGPAARSLIERADAIEGVAVERYSEHDLDDALDRSAVLTGFVIPAGFTASIESGVPAEVIVKRRGSGGDQGQIMASILQGVMLDLASEYELSSAVDALVSDAVPDEDIDGVVRDLPADARENPPVTVVTLSATEEEETDILDRLLPGIIVMFLLFSVTMSAQSLVEERRIGILERLMTTRLGVGQLFVGKFLAGVGRGIVQSLILLVLAFVVLRVGGFVAFAQSAVLALVVAAAVSSMGLVIASVARSQEQATWGAVFFTMAMTVFGGTFFPVGDSGPLNVLSRLTLNKYAIDAFEGILAETATLADHGLEIAVLGGITVVGLLIARLAFRVSVGGK